MFDEEKIDMTKVQGFVDELTEERGAEYAGVVVLAAKIKATICGMNDPKEREGFASMAVRLVMLTIRQQWPDLKREEELAFHQRLRDDADKLIDLAMMEVKKATTDE